MSFDYLDKDWRDISQITECCIKIDDKFQDFASLSRYLYIIIIEWNRDYPLPSIPTGPLVIEFTCDYNFPLHNLPSSIEIININSDYKFPLDNLPNIFELQIHSYCMYEYSHPLNFLPLSTKILNIRHCINQESANLPIKLKSLDISSKTFNDEVVMYPPELEKLILDNPITADSNENERLERYFNLAELPLTLKILTLPQIEISGLDAILNRLINLEELHIPYYFPNIILEYPPNLKKLYMFIDVHDTNRFELVNMPPSGYNGPLEAIAASNIEYLELHENKNLSIINYLPKSLKTLTILETHHERYQIAKQFPHIEIVVINDWDYREDMINAYRDEYF